MTDSAIWVRDGKVKKMRPIDADAAVERLQRRSDMFRFDKRYEAVMRDAIGEVLTMPTIDAVPVVHARWVAEIERMGHYSHCSKCECRCQGYVPNYKYCPNCGARMDGEAE